ncbi:hypothetical protein CLOM_g8116 [Closterium sp. NIES-68]|nr:hypothetical protein CLOM_g8116 [Closterium sp. NIES-68]GJP71135.1 hypothetical protein CLOP_g1983 [Closterium sp. NIES-67]
MSLDDGPDGPLEHTLLVVREVSVYKIPPRQSSGGYKCAEWLVGDKIWGGRLRVVSVGDKCEIRLEDSNTGELFAACHVTPGQRDASVEAATDSSRYFVLKIDDGRGRHAFIGLGFAERNAAFDFNVALTDHEKHVLNERQRADEVASGGAETAGEDSQPKLDLKLKEGETIRISMKKPSSSSSTSTSSKPSSSSSVRVGILAPPPGSSGIARLAPPGSSGSTARLAPPGTSSSSSSRSSASGGRSAAATGGAATAAAATGGAGGGVSAVPVSAPAGGGQVGAFADFSQIQSSLPSTTQPASSKAPASSSNAPAAAGWATF